jgi:hypothetical protein
MLLNNYKINLILPLTYKKVTIYPFRLSHFNQVQHRTHLAPHPQNLITKLPPTFNILTPHLANRQN